MKKPIVWTIAGSDSGGGAGIQADLHTFKALEVYGCSVITAVTAQNSVAVTAIHNIPAENIAAQITALAQDLMPKAIKLGMLGDDTSLTPILSFLEQFSGKVILDPVLVSTSAQALFVTDMNQHIAMLWAILPFCTVITPNIPEAETLLGITIHSHADMIYAAEKFLALGASSVIIKGGHVKQDLWAQDYWTDGKQAFWLASERRTNADYHGTGCSFAAAITAALALDYSLPDALVIAKMYVTQGVYQADQYGLGPAPVAHSTWPGSEKYLPYLSKNPLTTTVTPFPDCTQPLGLYPIVDRADWLEQLLPAGIKTIQLRIKDKVGKELEEQIKTAIAMAQQYKASLYINDFWQLAIQYGAYGVHLGQDDLSTADLEQIRSAGLRLGISTHNYYELAQAHTLKPSYIALGPIYPTTSKLMPHGPQGIARLKQWRSLLNYPLVAIGGIGLQQLPDIKATGVDGIAVLSAITQAKEPIKIVQEMLEFM